MSTKKGRKKTNWMTSSCEVTLKLDANKGIDEIKYYYANMVDYVRVILLLLSCYFLMGLANAKLNNMVGDYYSLMAGITIFISEMLDWIDGPIARYCKQCSFFGTIVDYLGDILGEVIILSWFLLCGNPYIFLLKFICLCNSTMCALVDSVMSFVGIEFIVPKYKNTNVYFWYINDLMLLFASPTQIKYSNFGCFCWMAYYWWQISLAIILTCEQDNIGFVIYYFNLLSVYILFIPCVLNQWLEFGFLYVLLHVWKEHKK